MNRLTPRLLLAVGFGCAVCSAAETCRYPEAARLLVTDWSGKLAAGYRAQLQRTPDDPATLFFVGVSLLAKDAPGAIRDLDRAVAKDPRYPWPYLVLADVYANPQPDPAKLAANMRAYRDLCPANLDAFDYLARVTDREQTRAFARQLRVLLEHTSATNDLNRYRELWAAEFRAASPAEFDTVRARIRSDLKRLEPLAGVDRTLLYTLQDGYRLTGQTDLSNRSLQEAGRPQGARAAYNDWRKQHPFSPSGSPDAERAYRKEMRKEAEELAAKWPDDQMSWTQMLETASNAEQARQAGEKMLEFMARNPDPGTRALTYGKVAQVWWNYGVRVQDVPDLADQALRDLDRREANAGPVKIRSSGGYQTDLYYELGRWDTWNALLEALLSVVPVSIGALDRARGVPMQMQAWLDAHPVGPDTPANILTFESRWQAFVDSAHGKVADAEGRKTDALSYFQRVLMESENGYPGNMIRERAEAIWKEQGGTADGWLAWSKPLPKHATYVEPKAVVENASGWTKIDRPLANLNLPDLGGKIWTVADLKGKVTLIDVWASWCGPCTAALPHIQALYNEIKQRADIQLITLNVDDNPGLADQFMKDQHYTFPTLLAESYFAAIQPPVSIPRMWIGDKTGAAHLEKINSNADATSATWVRDVLAELQRQ